MAGQKIIDTIHKMAKDQVNTSTPDLVYGVVESTSPLKIKVDNRFTIDSTFILLSALCVPSNQWRGLIIGDKVRMIRLNGGQIFYVLERDGSLQ